MRLFALTLVLLGARVAAAADDQRAAEAEKAVHGLARVNDPASAAYVAANALADETFGLSKSMRDLLYGGAELQPAALSNLVVATLDADETVRTLYRKACGGEWARTREAYAAAVTEKQRVELIVTQCKASFGDVVRPAYRPRLCAGAVLLAILAGEDLTVHGATSAAEQKLAHYVALLALAKAR